MNLSKFEPIKPSRSGDISLLVFKISKKAVKQPCLDQKIQCLFSKYSYYLCIFWHKIFRAFSYIPKCYFKIIKSGTLNIGQKRWLRAFISLLILNILNDYTQCADSISIGTVFYVQINQVHSLVLVIVWTRVQLTINSRVVSIKTSKLSEFFTYHEWINR